MPGFIVRALAVSVLFAVLLAFSGYAAADKRIALVIGNGAYDASPLRNPPNDARLIARTLRELGFEVSEHLDLDEEQMLQAVEAFGDRLVRAGEDSVALFYYAGHGVQFEGRNYLIPVGTGIERRFQLRTRAVPAEEVLGVMDLARSRMKVLILDACRNNPFRGFFRTPTSGLTQMQAPSGTLIAYATAPGAVADDGTGDNSPYSAALARAMVEPGVPVEQMFKRVRVEVKRRTGGAQTPWESSSLTGIFYFKPGAQAADRPPAPAAPSAEVVFWQSIATSTNPADFEVYLRHFPDGAFAGLARNRLEALKRQAAAVPPRPVPRPAGPAKPAVGAHPKPYKLGDTFKDCDVCPEMVVVPAGEFMMGAQASEAYLGSDVGPQLPVRIAKPFAAGVYEVTNAQFVAFLNDTDLVLLGDEPGVWFATKGQGPVDSHIVRAEGGHYQVEPGYENHPITYISWYGAKAYTAWLRSKTGAEYRLLTDAEWEYAARANSVTRYWWGDEDPVCRVGATNGAKYDDDEGCNDTGTEPVGSYSANMFGLFDVLGNVWEWVAECDTVYASKMHNDEASIGRRGISPLNCNMRGGSWEDAMRKIRSASWGYSPVDYLGGSLGLRVARTL